MRDERQDPLTRDSAHQRILAKLDSFDTVPLDSQRELAWFGLLSNHGGWLRAPGALEHPARTATDGQTNTEVVEQAQRIVAIARLQHATAGYLLLSCKDRDDPPYQGAIYMNFTLPADPRPDEYFEAIADAMVARGWNAGLPPNQHLHGKTLSKDGVAAVLY